MLSGVRVELARLSLASAAKIIVWGGDNPATRPIVVAIPPIIDRSIFIGDLCTLSHSAVAVEEALVDVDFGTSVEVATRTFGFGRSTESLGFCTETFRLRGGGGFAGGLDMLFGFGRAGTEVVWMGGGLIPGGEDGSVDCIRRCSVKDLLGGGFREAFFFFFATLETSFPFFHGWIEMAAPRLVAGLGSSSSSEGGLVLFCLHCSAASAAFASL